MGTIHEFFYDHKWLGVLIFLAGMTYSGFLYFRVYGLWLSGQRGSDDRLRQHLKEQTSKSGSTDGGRMVHPPSTSEGQQEDLLSRLAREDSDDGDDLAATTARGTRNDLKPDPAHRSTHILKSSEDGATDTEGEERTPLQNAIRAAVDESLREEEDGLQSGGFDAPDAPVATDEDPLAGLVDTAEAPVAEPRQRKASSPENAQRIASRHEELGLHREVHADTINDPGVRRISDDDRKRRLSQLGIALDADTVESDAQRKARLGTDELDDILGRLDAALADSGGGLDLSDDQPGATAEPVASADQHAPTMPMGEPPVAEAPPVDQHPPTLAMDAAPADDPVAEAPPVDQHAPTLPMDAAPAEVGDEPRSDSAAEALDDDEDLVVRDGRTTTADHDEIESAGEREASDDERGDSDDGIPDWARADTFDDDGDEGPEQQKLF